MTPSYFEIDIFAKCCSWIVLCSKGLINFEYFRELSFAQIIYVQFSMIVCIFLLLSFNTKSKIILEQLL